MSSHEAYRLRLWARRAGLVALSLAATSSTTQDSHACGGCFVPSDANTQVVGHRMVLSIGKERSTLWDQIVYDGDPGSFAWILPIRGQVEVGLSADGTFQLLERETLVTVLSPPNSCFSNGGGQASADSPGAPSDSGPPPAGKDEEAVEVISHEVVGPYETVQLASEDPDALRAWLESHGYQVPDDIAPVIDAYVAEDFGFLALKLVPGEGVDAMRPVRVSTPGAEVALPLRMVAAGTGAKTPITLWVLGEGRYEPQNFPSFEIDEGDLVWDWDSSSSNYRELVQEGYATGEGRAWLVEFTGPAAAYWTQAAWPQSWGAALGYADENGDASSDDEADADWDALVGGLDPSSTWVTRLSAELPRAALAEDLRLQAASLQAATEPRLQATKESGTIPDCTTSPPPKRPWYRGGPGSASCTAGHRADASAAWLAVVGLFAGALARRTRRRW